MRPPRIETQALDEELHEDMAAARADGLADADFARLPATDTSMMFMMPMPPTSSEMVAMPAKHERKRS